MPFRGLALLSLALTGSFLPHLKQEKGLGSYLSHSSHSLLPLQERAQHD